MAIFPTTSRLSPRFRAMIAVGLMAVLTSHGAHYRDRWQRLEFYRGGGTIQALTSQGASGVARHDDTYPSRLAALASRPTVTNPDLETGPTVALPAMELALKVIDQRFSREPVKPLQ